jgi:hypothetical protein
MAYVIPYLPLIIVLTIVVAVILYMRRHGLAPHSKTWLEPRAFVIATLLMAIAQYGKIMQSGISIGGIVIAIVTCIFGGVFWGAIGTFFYNRSRRKL